MPMFFVLFFYPEISTVRLAARSVEAAKERENQSQQSCDKTTQNQEHHSVHVPLKGEAMTLLHVVWLLFINT